MASVVVEHTNYQTGIIRKENREHFKVLKEINKIKDLDSENYCKLWNIFSKGIALRFKD